MVQLYIYEMIICVIFEKKFSMAIARLMQKTSEEIIHHSSIYAEAIKTEAN